MPHGYFFILVFFQRHRITLTGDFTVSLYDRFFLFCDLASFLKVEVCDVVSHR